MIRFFQGFLLRSRSKSTEDLKLIRFLIKQLGYRPDNLDYFKEALTHKSLSNQKENLTSNERLEFLGDTILDAVVADYLFNKFPGQDEGYLTKVKSKIVSRQTLSDVAASMGLSEFVRYQQSKSLRMATIEGNAFEALIGAIYLDGGFDAAQKTINHYVFRLHINLTNLLETEIDFKSKLYIWSQKNKLAIDFDLLREDNSSGTWEYEIEVTINKQPYGRGKGTSKKEAEQAASKETLTLIGLI